MPDHGPTCWREHLDCAVARVEQLDRQLARRLAERPFRRVVMGCGHVMYWPAGEAPEGRCLGCWQARAQVLEERLAEIGSSYETWREVIEALRRRIARRLERRRG